MILANAFMLMAPSGGANGQPADPIQSLITTLVMFGAVIGIMYFMMIRPQQKRAKEAKLLLESMTKGDKVVTSSGIHGSIVEMDEKTVTLQVSDNARIKFEKVAVVSILNKNNK
jgi:preprotein translocase subunit YajC